MEHILTPLQKPSIQELEVLIRDVSRCFYCRIMSPLDTSKEENHFPAASCAGSEAEEATGHEQLNHE